MPQKEMAKKKRKKRRTHKQEFLADFKRLSPARQRRILKANIVRARAAGLLILLLVLYFVAQLMI